MIDYEDIGAAIVTRFAAAVTPTGEDDLALCTDEPPDQLGSGPAVVVFQPTEDNLEWGPSETLYSVQHWPVRFYRTQGPEFGSRMQALAKWRLAFLTVVVGQIQLGLHADGVDKAELTKIDAVEATYGDVKFDCLDMNVDVQVRTQVTAAA